MRHSECGLEKDFQTQAISERSEFIKTKGRDKAGSASAMGPHLHRPGDADSFHELIANFYSLKAKLLLDG